MVTLFTRATPGTPASDIIKLLEKNIDEINKFRIRHKTTKPKDIQKIFFPKDKKTLALTRALHGTKTFVEIIKKFLAMSFMMSIKTP